MSLNSFLNSLILLGALQGFVIGGILFVSSKERPSGKILAWLLCIMALACLKIYLLNIGLASTQAGSLIDALVPFMIIMPVGPLIYFYCKAELLPGFTITRKDRIHFYPVIVDLFQHAAALVFVFVLIFGWVNPQKNNFGVWFDTYNVYADIPRWISLTVYLYLSFRLLMKDSPALSWLKEFLVVFLLFDFLWLVYLVPYVIPKYTDTVLSTVDWYPIYLPLVVIIYWLGIRGFLIGKSEMRFLKRPSSSPLSEEIITRLSIGLQNAMEKDKLYRDAGLTLAKLAKHLDSSPKMISAVLNQKLGNSFNEYVNQFRVREIKERLANSESRKFTITAIAYECGFNSQPTFQRAFKNIVGLTPSEFMQQKGEAV